MKKEQYKNIFKSMLIASGRKKQWIQGLMNMNKITFYRAVHNDTLSDGQKEKIKKLLSK